MTTSTTSTPSWPITNTDVDEAIHAVKDNADAIFTWDYEKGAGPALNKLYEKAKHSQWNGETDLDWSIEVDQEEFARDDDRSCDKAELGPRPGIDLDGHARSRSGATRSGSQLSIESQNWRSQPVHARRAGRADLHGQDRRDRAVDRRQVLRRHPGDGRGPPRRGVRQVPRHQAQRATTRSTPTCKMLLDDIINDSRWDMTYLGMQIMVEGLALAAFGMAMPDHARTRCSSSSSAT